MPEALKTLVLEFDGNQWSVAKSIYVDLPLIPKDLHQLTRLLKVEVRRALREYNLKFRAHKRETASLTGKKG